MFNCKTTEEARKRKDAIIADCKDVAEEAMNCLDEGFENAMSVMILPHYLRKYFRTSNHIERLNKELFQTRLSEHDRQRSQHDST